MSLVTEINRTEAEKNKTKQVATQIDNKLVELGGERATNLADVPNKIKTMIESYVKTATGTIKNVEANANNKGFAYVTVPLNLQAEPKKIIIKLKTKISYQSTYKYEGTIEFDLGQKRTYYPKASYVIQNIRLDELNKTRAYFFFDVYTEEKHFVSIDWLTVM